MARRLAFYVLAAFVLIVLSAWLIASARLVLIG